MDEEKLIAAFKARDPDALRQVLDRCGDRLLRSAFLLCGNGADAQDMVQDTFLQAMRSAPRFRGGSSISTWLHAILLNLTRHYHRSRKRIVYDDELVRREISPPDEQPAQLDVAITSAALTQALQRLSVPHREALVLRYYQDLKIHEIARLLGVSKGTVKSRLHYAIQEMRRFLPDNLNLFGGRGTEEARIQ